MVMERDNMFYEACERLAVLETDASVRCNFLTERKLTKISVNHEAHSIRKDEITSEELQLIRNLETEKSILIYYMIQDEGMWPDGCTFKRYTFLHVNKCEDEYQMVKDECIGRCKTVPAYVVNFEEPDCSEFAEIAFMNVKGFIINVS